MTAQVIDMPSPEERKWAKADAAYTKGVEAYIEFGIAIAEIDATQEEIARRYSMSRSAIERVIAVGKDRRFDRNTIIPKSIHSLYLLTTLDDVGFEKLCKPDTTQEMILEYKKASKPQKGWPSVLVDHGHLGHSKIASGEGRKRHRKKIAEAIGYEPPSHFASQEEADKFERDFVRAFPDAKRPDYGLSMTAQQKLDRAIELEKLRLQSLFEKEVFEEAARRMPELMAQRRQALDEAIAEKAHYFTLAKGIKKTISEDEYRFLLQLMHPDRAPDGRKDQYSKAFRIIRKLQEYAEA